MRAKEAPAFRDRACWRHRHASEFATIMLLKENKFQKGTVVPPFFEGRPTRLLHREGQERLPALAHCVFTVRSPSL